jgi:hypothetical protein
LSVAVTVSTVVPAPTFTDGIDHAVVPDAMPLWPLSVDQATCAMPWSSAATPATVTVDAEGA